MDRDDYREGTITRVVTAVAEETPVVFDNEDAIEVDGQPNILLSASLAKEGWFPKGELSLIGAPSDVGKISWAMPMLEKIRQAQSDYQLYRSWQDETGAPMKVQKELMRHAFIQTTMNVHEQAMTSSKREANSKVVEMVLKTMKASD